MKPTYWRVTIYKRNGRKEVREQLYRSQALELADQLITLRSVEAVYAKETPIG